MRKEISLLSLGHAAREAVARLVPTAERDSSAGYARIWLRAFFRAWEVDRHQKDVDRINRDVASLAAGDDVAGTTDEVVVRIEARAWLASELHRHCRALDSDKAQLGSLRQTFAYAELVDDAAARAHELRGAWILIERDAPGHGHHGPSGAAAGG